MSLYHRNISSKRLQIALRESYPLRRALVIGWGVTVGLSKSTREAIGSACTGLYTVPVDTLDGAYKSLIGARIHGRIRIQDNGTVSNYSSIVSNSTEPYLDHYEPNDIPISLDLIQLGLDSVNGNLAHEINEYIKESLIPRLDPVSPTEPVPEVPVVPPVAPPTPCAPCAAPTQQYVPTTEVPQPSIITAEGGNTMQTSTSNFRLVNIQLIDNSAGLKPEQRLIVVYSNIPADGTDEQVKLQAVANHNVAGALDAHNERRKNWVDERILESTGNEVKLRPIELRDVEFRLVPA